MSYDDMPIDEFFKLRKNPPHNKRVRLYNDKGKRVKPVSQPNKHRYTNNELATMIAKLTKSMNAGFKRVNTRIDRIEARLDYNNLKKLPKTKI